MFPACCIWSHRGHCNGDEVSEVLSLSFQKDSWWEGAIDSVFSQNVLCCSPTLLPNQETAGP